MGKSQLFKPVRSWTHLSATAGSLCCLCLSLHHSRLEGLSPVRLFSPCPPPRSAGGCSAVWLPLHVTSLHRPCAVPPTSLPTALHPALTALGERNRGSLEGGAAIPGSGVISKWVYRWGWLPGALMGKAGGFQGCVFQQKYAESEPFSHTQNFQIKMSFQQIPQTPVKTACFQSWISWDHWGKSAKMTETCKVIKKALGEYLHHFY